MPSIFPRCYRNMVIAKINDFTLDITKRFINIRIAQMGQMCFFSIALLLIKWNNELNGAEFYLSEAALRFR